MPPRRTAMLSNPKPTRAPQIHNCSLMYVLPGSEVKERWGGFDHTAGSGPILVSYSDGIRMRREFFCGFEHLREWIDRRVQL